MTHKTNSLPSTQPLIEVSDLQLHYPIEKKLFSRKKTVLHAVDGVSFSIQAGQTLGLVGESGCGKSTVGRSLLRLVEPTAGTVRYHGQNILDLSATDMRALRQKMQIIFQDPYGSLNPRMTVADLVGEPLKIHYKLAEHVRRQKIIALLEKVGLAEYHLDRYPHEFSGGQRQRIGIARALACDPAFLVCDEPISALDVSIQSQIINLLKKLQDDLGLTYLFIAHDLSIVKHISHEIAVMYLGKIVEIAPSDALFKDPEHPYTQALLSAIPDPDPDRQQDQLLLAGDLPSAVNLPDGCRFHTRCPYKMPICEKVEPVLLETDFAHRTACHLTDLTHQKYNHL